MDSFRKPNTYRNINSCGGSEIYLFEDYHYV